MAYQQHTWAEIRSRLFDRVERQPFWEAQELQDAFNEALYLWNLCTGWWQARVTQLTTANTRFYTVSSPMLYRVRIEFNGRALVSTTKESLNQARYQWRTETTTSGGDVPTQPVHWAPIDLTSFYLWPADAVGGNTLTIDGVAATPILTTDGAYLDLGDEQLDILLNLGVHLLAFKKGGATFAATQPLLEDFLKAAIEENQQIKASNVLRRLAGLDDDSEKPYRGGGEQLSAVVAGTGGAA